MKIKTKIAFASLVITIVSISFLFLFIYFGMNRLLYSSLDRTLSQIASNIEGNFMEEYYEGDKREERRLELVGANNYWLRVLNEDGEVLETSLLGEKLDIPLKLTSRTNRYFNVKIKRGNLYDSRLLPGKKSEISFRMYARRINGDFFKGWIIVGLPIEQIKKAQGNLLTLGVFGIILISFITTFFTFVFTGRVLKPLETIAKKASRIGEENIKGSIFEEKRRDEIGILASALNNMLDRLKKAIESQKRFISDASHELKTPISILRTHWENELNNPALPLQFREKMAKDIEVLSKMSSMIEDLLILSITEEKRKNITKEPFYITELMKELIEDVKILTASRKQELNYTEEDSIQLLGDRTLLYRVFLNIIKNSVEYTPEGGRIDVLVSREGNNAIIEIKDNGIGIPEEELPNIFERFYRVERSRSKIYGGSGLGLSIAKWIVEAHGGTIKIKSKEGEGTTVTVFLPLT